jgi:hypothetical protein
MIVELVILALATALVLAFAREGPAIHLLARIGGLAFFIHEIVLIAKLLIGSSAG